MHVFAESYVFSDGTGIYHTDQGKWEEVMEICRPIYHTAVRCACKGMSVFYWKGGDNVLKKKKQIESQENDHAGVWNAEEYVTASWR